MVKCTFCGIEIPKATGKMFVKTDGKVYYFCSNKCEKNLIKLGRKPIATRWSKHYITASQRKGKKKK